MTKYSLSLFIFFTLATYSSFAQYSISGTILNEQKEPISFANILLLEGTDSTYINGQVSDEAGFFKWKEIPPGSYLINISYLGYENKFLPIDLQTDLALGDLLLQAEATSLNAVVVSGRRQLISKKIDRLVFDVENSSKAAQGDALDVLSVTPGIRVRNETVSMIGKSGVSVMINDKMVRLTNEELSNFLRSISSEDIKKIEVITTPPSKYEAEGNSGLINIQLKKAKKDSWNLSLRSDFRKRSHPRFSNGVGFIYNKNKLSISSSVYSLNGTYRQTQVNYSHFPDGLWYTESSFNRAFDELSGRLDVGYDVTPKWIIGGQYIYNFAKQKTDETPYTLVSDYETEAPLQTLNSVGDVGQLTHIHSINLYNHFDLDTLGKKLKINLDYFNFDDVEDKTYDGISIVESPYYKQYFAGLNISNRLISNASAAIDFEIPNKVADLEFGGKVTRSISDNGIDQFNSELVNEPILDFPISANDFEYIENIQAAYLSAHKKINEKWAIRMGLRMEATQTSSVSNNLGFDLKNDYLKFFPTIYLGHTLTENTSINMSYNKRISRAPFHMLSPNPWVANPFQSVVGNPFLQPSFSDNFEVSMTYKNISISTYYNIQEDIFTQVPIPNAATNSVVFKFENFVNSKKTGIHISHLFEPYKWWSSSNSIDFNYAINEYQNEGKITSKTGYNSNFSTSNDFYLNKNKTLSLHINYWYSPVGVDDIWNIKPISNLSASIQCLLLNKKLKLTLGGNDIFKTQKERITTTVDGIFQDIYVYYDARYIRFAATYNLGNSTASTKKNKVGNQQERNRAGRF